MGTHSLRSQVRGTSSKQENSIRCFFQTQRPTPCLENFPKSSPSTPWLPNTLLRRDGIKWRTSRLPLVASLLPRPVLAQLNSTTSTVVSMLVTGIATKTSLRSLMLSSRTTMELVLMPSIPPTWMLPRSLETLTLLFQFTPPVSVLDVPSMDMVFPPESPSNNVLMLKS